MRSLFPLLKACWRVCLLVPSPIKANASHLGIIADEEPTHPFCVSYVLPLISIHSLICCRHREHEIIHYPSSCFVIGRSGTG